MADIKKFSRVAIDKLKPYENNAKQHSADQVAKIAASIYEFGFLAPVLIDKEFNVIAGHGRIQAAKEIGLSDVPCAMVDGLTDEQRKAYILVDNKLSEFGKWDKDLLESEIAELLDQDFDVEQFGFDVPELTNPADDWYGSERKRTTDAYNMDLVDEVTLTSDFWQMPVIEKDDFIPSDLIGFNYAKTNKDKNCGIHCFVDDYQFERLWNNPEKYIDVLKEYECVLSPDYSLYMSMTMPNKIWNVYRSRLIGSFYQQRGIKVIPTISWAEKETFKFCFEGVEKGGVVAISTIGVKESDDAFQIWKDGVDEMIKRLKPSAILVYGGEVDYDYGKIKVVYYNNEVLDKWTENSDD